MPITVRELKPAETHLIYPLIALLNPGMRKVRFTRMLKQMLPGGYRVVAAFDGKIIVGCSGFWLRTRFWCSRQMDIDNFIVAESARNQGIGRQLVAWLETKACHEKCELIVLDTYIASTHAQDFYGRLGFYKTGYHLTKMPGSSQPGQLPYKSSSR